MSDLAPVAVTMPRMAIRAPCSDALNASWCCWARMPRPYTEHCRTLWSLSLHPAMSCGTASFMYLAEPASIMDYQIPANPDLPLLALLPSTLWHQATDCAVFFAEHVAQLAHQSLSHLPLTTSFRVQGATAEHLPARTLGCRQVGRGRLVAPLRCGAGPGGAPWTA